MKSEDYICEPFNERYVKVLIEVAPCIHCKRPTTWNLDHTYHTPFPKYHAVRFAEQCKRSGIQIAHGNSAGTYNEIICRECFEAGQETVTCELCEQKVKMSETQESFGWPADYLCKHCHETVPAKQWQAKVEALEEKHKYDFCCLTANQRAHLGDKLRAK